MGYPIKKYQYRPPLYGITNQKVKDIIPWTVPEGLRDQVQEFLDIVIGSEYGDAEIDTKRIQTGLIPRFTSNVDMPYMIWIGELSGGYPTIRNGSDSASIAGNDFTIVSSNNEFWSKFPNGFEFEKWIQTPSDLSGTVGFMYAIDSATGSGYYYCVQAAASTSGMRIFDENFNLVATTIFDIKEQSQLVQGSDEVHDGTETGNDKYFAFKLKNLPVYSGIVLTHESGTLNVPHPTSMVFRDVGGYSPTEVDYESYNRINWMEDGVSVDSSGNVRISHSTSFINGNNVSPFVSGWSEVEFEYDEFYKPSGTVYHSKSDITSNIWPHTSQYIKFFDFQKLDKYLDMNIGANLTNCTVTQSGLTPIFSGIVELERGYTVSGNIIVSGNIDPLDTSGEYRYIVASPLGDIYFSVVESGGYLYKYNGNTGWSAYTPTSIDSIIARMVTKDSGILDWKIYDTEIKRTPHSARMRFYPSGTYFEYETNDWAGIDVTDWKCGKTNEHIIHLTYAPVYNANSLNAYRVPKFAVQISGEGWAPLQFSSLASGEVYSIPGTDATGVIYSNDESIRSHVFDVTSVQKHDIDIDKILGSKIKIDSTEYGHVEYAGIIDTYRYSIPSGEMVAKICRYDITPTNISGDFYNEVSIPMDNKTWQYWKLDIQEPEDAVFSFLDTITTVSGTDARVVRVVPVDDSIKIGLSTWLSGVDDLIFTADSGIFQTRGQYLYTTYRRTTIPTTATGNCSFVGHVWDEFELLPSGSGIDCGKTYAKLRFNTTLDSGDPKTLKFAIFPASGSDSATYIDLYSITGEPFSRPKFIQNPRDPFRENIQRTIGPFISEYLYTDSSIITDIVIPDTYLDKQAASDAIYVTRKYPGQTEELSYTNHKFDGYNMVVSVPCDQLRPSASTNGPFFSGYLVCTYSGQYIIEITNTVSGKAYYVGQPNEYTQIDPYGVSLHVNSDCTESPTDSYITQQYYVDGSKLYVSGASYEQGTIYAKVPYIATFVRATCALQSLATDSVLVSGSVINGRFESGVYTGDIVYKQMSTYDVYSGIYSNPIEGYIIPRTILPFTLLPHEKTAILAGPVSLGVYKTEHFVCGAHNPYTDEFIYLTDDQRIKVFSSTGEEKYTAMFMPRMGYDEVSTYYMNINGMSTPFHFFDYRIKETHDVKDMCVYGDFLYFLEPTGSVSRIWRTNLFNDEYQIRYEASGFMNTESPTINYEYEYFDIPLSGSTSMTIGPEDTIVLKNSDGIHFYNQKFRYAFPDFNNNTVLFREDPDVSGQLFKNYDFRYGVSGVVALPGSYANLSGAPFIYDHSIRTSGLVTTDYYPVESGIDYSARIWYMSSSSGLINMKFHDDSYGFLYESGLWFDPTSSVDNTNWDCFECNITNSGSGTFMLVEVSGNINLGALEFGVSGAYHSSAKPLWNYYDELGILAGLERMPGESNVDFKARISSQLTYKPGVSHQGIINGLAAEFGLTRYNVETKTLYNLANIPAMYLDPNVRTSGIAPIYVWVNDVPWGRVYEAVSSEWSGYFLNDSQPSGTPLYYDTYGNVAVTSGWIIWRDPEGQYTNRLEVLGAPDEAVIKVQYYVLNSENKAQAVVEGGDATDEYWIAKTPTSGNYSVITFNDDTIQSLFLTGSGSYIKSVVEEVRDKAPVEYGKLRFGYNFWPITQGSFTGLSSVFDASTSGA